MIEKSNFKTENVRYVNRKQFHYLLCKFMKKHKIMDRFYNDSMEYKNSMGMKCYPSLYEEFKINSTDSFSEHLYKCIDIYCYGFNEGKRYLNDYYYGKIYGFFRLVPATFRDGWESFWQKISNKWADEVDMLYFKDDDYSRKF